MNKKKKSLPGLQPESESALKHLRDSVVSPPSAPLSEMDGACLRLEQSHTCARSATLLRLLRFLIEHADSLGDGPKETYIGSVLYGRQGTYDPRFDSIVRVNVKRLRARLLKYNDGEGKYDLHRIVIPVGTYTVVLEKLVVEASMTYDPTVQGERRTTRRAGPGRWIPWS